jgi:ABC-type transport system involved in multi-copper enzyme maturation permease subunit
MTGRDGFTQVLRGELTKLVTVRSTVWCVLATIGLTVLLTTLATSVGSTNANEGPRFVDEFHFVHQPLTGDGTVTAHVVSQERSQEWAKAGIMIKAGAANGAPYAAIMVTPDHGVRLQSTFDTDISGNGGTVPRWLRLTRTGASVAGFESTDGNSWRQVGTVNVGALPASAEAGLFVSSPPKIETVKTNGGNETRGSATQGAAVFDNVSGTSLTPGRWTDDTVRPPGGDPLANEGRSAEEAGRFTVVGSGDVAGYGIASWQPPGNDDIVANSLGGVQVGLMAVVALGVLFGTSEFKTGTIRTTFAASPRRARVLVAKALVLGGSVFLAGLFASVIAFLIGQRNMRRHGYEPPAYPYVSLTDGPALRAIIGSALFLAVLAVFSLGIGTIRRRTVGAIVVVLALVVVPQILAPVMSLNAEVWINRLTPVAGLAIQRTTERFDDAIAPWAGLAVLAAYAAVAFGFALWQLRKRDA